MFTRKTERKEKKEQEKRLSRSRLCQATTVGRQNVAAMAVTDTANIINSLTSKSCPSFPSVELETRSRRKDVNAPFPNTQELSDFLVFKPMQDLQLLHRYKVKQLPLYMCASESGRFLN